MSIPNVVLPGKLASALGKNPEATEKGFKPLDIGEPCKPIDKMLAAKIAKKLKESDKPILCSGKNSGGSAGKPLLEFIVEAFKLSAKQGYLDTNDVAKLASFTQWTDNAGSKHFRNVCTILFKKGMLTRVTKTKQEFNLDLSEEISEDDDIMGLFE